MARSDYHRRKSEKPSRRVTLRIDDIAPAGDGAGMLDGARIYAPLTAPGDVIEADVSGARANLVGIIEASSVRRAAPCAHYGRCGGCSLQHLDADFYRGWKRRRVVDALAREGLDPALVGEVVETPAASRRRATFSFERAKGGARLGFNARRSSEIAAIDGCLVLEPALASRLEAFSKIAALFDGRTADATATLCDNGIDLALAGKGLGDLSPAASAAALSLMRGATIVRLSANGAIVLQLADPVVSFSGVAVSPPPGGFLQASRAGEAALFARVDAATKDARRIADLFAGCGTFALPLARRASVLAVDGGKPAIAALGAAARRAQGDGLNPVETEARDLFERPLTAKELKRFDAVVFDPPRAGAAAQAAEIAKSAARVVVAVSCNPSTFARDAATLVAGGYKLDEATPVDQFLWTPHVEIVGVFSKG